MALLPDWVVDGRVRSIVVMDAVLAAKVWHYWIGIAILLPAILAVLATVVAYLVKVTSNKYPRQ